MSSIHRATQGEEMLEGPVLRMLRGMGYNVATQVRFMGKTVDVVAGKRPRPHLVTVELKVADWRRALRQAYLNQTMSRLAYIAMHEGFVHRAPAGELEQLGIGLMAVGRQARVLVPPRATNAENRILASQLWAKVMEG